ncbi:MAG: response regulator [Spirochaetes bacterium]|nr:response regulator [Spirochaetota bacterium]
MIYKKNAHIIVIDDEIEICEIIKSVLEGEGFLVKAYSDSRKFVEEIGFYNNDTLDLIILDLMMPEYDGFQVLELLNSKKETRFIPKIVISAFPSQENIKDVYQYGAIQFIQKPLAIEELIYQVKTLLRIKLYEDNNRIMIKLLKDKNKKLISEIEKRNVLLSEQEVDKIGNNLDTMSRLIHINFQLFKMIYNKLKDHELQIIDEGKDLLEELLLSSKALDDKKEELEEISNFLTQVFEDYSHQ